MWLSQKAVTVLAIMFIQQNISIPLWMPIIMLRIIKYDSLGKYVSGSAFLQNINS